MDTDVALVDFAPTLQLLSLAALVALVPLAWVWLRQRRADPRARLAALTALTLFLTFDLIVFGSFTRLTDSGLGCPDWPGCYGSASPLGARGDIAAAEAAMPTGPVTWSKAWIEMIHRYLAMTVGALILVTTLFSWAARSRLPHSPWWPTFTLLWVIVQGLFGKYTVTLKLYPAIVTLHLLGGIALLALLAIQHVAFRDRALALSTGLRRGAGFVMALLVLQIALGGWVSTNYAVLACSGFPSCSGQWWPTMDFAHGFTLLRDLGHTADGALLPFEALVAIHYVHRSFAYLVVAAMLVLAWALWRSGEPARRFALALLALTALQFATGLSNVVLDWPIVAALIHSGGAAAMTGVLTVLLARARLAAVRGREAAALALAT
ncbi:MAG TPA: COX15/CtaA family protein [Rubrivivax sp.]|jgi:cytochrome c oxidase assembly protein subunit 15|nr:COX15/CtaA family protein [Burkholderiaceae bacterium]HMR69273.1 COX15/CtaA family protein [Rubrivivax sp.]